jgi:hypothetical protein
LKRRHGASAHRHTWALFGYFCGLFVWHILALVVLYIPTRLGKGFLTGLSALQLANIRHHVLLVCGYALLPFCTASTAAMVSLLYIRHSETNAGTSVEIGARSQQFDP